MNSLRRVLWLLAFAVAGCGHQKQPGPDFRFLYHPPDSASFVVELAMARISEAADQRVADSTWSRTRHFQVATDRGCRLTGITDSITVFRDGELLDNPVVRLFASRPITYLIDTSGRALDVQGYAEIFADLDSTLGPETAALVRQRVDSAALRQHEVNAWNDRFQPFVGRRLAPGSLVLDTTYPVLPSEGRLPHYEIIEVIDTLRVGSRLCAGVRVTASTNPAELARLADRSVAEVVDLFGLTEDVVSRAQLRLAGTSSVREWVLEYETMLSHSETERKDTFYHELAASGMQIKHRITEIRNKEFTYPE